MSYTALAAIAEWEICLFLSALAGILIFKLLTGKINTRYLLYGTRRDGSRYFSPERVQLLAVTLSVAFQYLMNAMHTEKGRMPDVPAGTLALLGLSNAAYLGGKAWAFFKTSSTEMENNG